MYNTEYVNSIYSIPLALYTHAHIYIYIHTHTYALNKWCYFWHQ